MSCGPGPGASGCGEDWRVHGSPRPGPAWGSGTSPARALPAPCTETLKKSGAERPVNPAGSPVGRISTANRPKPCESHLLTHAWTPPRDSC